MVRTLARSLVASSIPLFVRSLEERITNEIRLLFSISFMYACVQVQYDPLLSLKLTHNFPILFSTKCSVMICLPYGSVNSSGSRGWGGYAYINHYLQVLNNNRCQRVSTMVHEFGHNLNLGKYKVQAQRSL